MNKLKIISDLKKLDKSLSQSHTPSIDIDTSCCSIKCSSYIYEPNQTFLKFHGCNDDVRLVMGPYGSGKSSGMCAEIMFRAVTMPPCIDGICRSKWIVVRNTSGELETTTLQTWLHWFGNVGSVVSHKKPVLEHTHTFTAYIGGVKKKCSLDLIFLALDRPEDIKKIKSLEITGAFLNELSELPYDILLHLKSRLHRYPSSSMIVSNYWSGIIADTNPPDTDSWIYRLFEIDRPDNHRIFKQPPGIFLDADGEYIVNEDADNFKNLKSRTYYIDMAKGSTKEFIKVFCMGEYGSVINSKKVYEGYNDDLHSSDDIKIEDFSPLIIGWDFGLTPACLIAQLKSNGQLIVIKEFCTDYLSVRELAENIVKPYLNNNFYNFSYTSIGDPSDSPSDSTKQSCIMILNECGINTSKALTNNIISRIDAVKQYLNALINGKPSIMIDKRTCPVLRKGFLGKYNYKRVRVLGEEKYRDIPDKSHPYSDIQDCLQYICLNCKINNQNSGISPDFYEEKSPWG